MTVRTPILPKVRGQNNRDSLHTRRDSSQWDQNNERSFLQLKEENSRLRTDISRLRIEKAQLRDENTQLKNTNSQLQDELRFTGEELQEEKKISEHKDVELAKNTALYNILEEEYLRLLVN